MRTLQYGNRGKDVVTLQRLLHLVQDGIFGKITREAVIVFQAEHKLKVDGVVGPKTWEALLNQQEELVKSRRTIKYIIIHCTATKEGENHTVAEVTSWHKKRGFSTIGYHYLIDINGKINNGRDVNLVGAHCVGYNTYSIGVCYVGGLDINGNTKDTRTDAQKASLERLLRRLKEQKFYPNAKIYGHNNFAAKACPCFNAEYEYSNI